MGNEIELKAGGVVGRPEDRVDGRLKVTGGARYSAEMHIAGAAYAVMAMSTIARGRIVSMDTSKASAQHGVRLILTPFNAPRLPNAPSQAKPNLQSRILSLMQDDQVHYQNQPIALVIADTLEAAQYAATLVKPTYAAQHPLTDMDAERKNAYKPKKANQDSPDTQRGDPDGALSAAAARIEHVYATPMENHNPMEPHATIAVWDAPDRLTVYDATQGIFGVRSVLSRIWNLPPSNVECIAYFVGGGFGCKGSAWSHVPLAAMAAKAVNRPVKLVLSRQQMFGMTGYRPQTEQTLRLGADASGKLVAIRHDSLTQTSTFDEFVEPSAVTTRMLYSCPNVATSHRVARLNYGTPTFMRAPGESSGTYALESAMDELAAALKMDPLDLRMTNYAETDEQENKPYSSKSLRQCYTLGAARFGWRERSSAPRTKRTAGGLLIGYGIGTATYPVRRSPASAHGRIMPDGTAEITAGTQDIGTGTYTVMRQVAADGLGMPYDNVTFLLGDTKMPQTPVSGGSQTAASTGSAVLAVSLALKQKLLEQAVADTKSPLYSLTPADLDINAGRIVVRADPSKSVDIASVVAASGLPWIAADATSTPDSDREAYSMHSFGAVFTEIHVDPDLGRMSLARIVGAYGVGNRLNAKTARSQLIGGIVYGIGMALMEETIPDRRNGRIANADLAEYLVPVNADVPPIDILFVDETDPHVNPLGVKGVGEIGITGVVGSIANAVYNATGVRVRDLPITLDKVMA